MQSPEQASHPRELPFSRVEYGPWLVAVVRVVALAAVLVAGPLAGQGAQVLVPRQGPQAEPQIDHPRVSQSA